uniref:Putative pre-mrna-splicing factor cwc21 ixodes scapularis pre-mrna-splicing factor cwc21 n=1 Tax=Ornithodoros turicata TaxID=34597 RepID=A0A2R5LAQ7_9ACAR
MYNGIGLQTPRGSGTNGYVQRNLCFVNRLKDKVNYKTEEDIKQLDALMNRKANQEILDHERKRKLEIRCLELQEEMEEQGYTEAEIETKVEEFRQALLEQADVLDMGVLRDASGRPIVKETHQMAEANQEKNAKLKEALGIGPFFVEGSSLDPDRKAKEAQAASEAQKQYSIILDPESSPESEPKPAKKKSKEKDQEIADQRSPSPEQSKKKKSTSSARKHKHDRSESPEARHKKSSKTKKKHQEKEKRKGRKSASPDAKHRHKKGRTPSASSSSSGDSSSSDNESESDASRSSSSSSDDSR